MTRFILAVSVLLSTISFSDARSEERKPNIVFILADDLGYGDLGCYGATDIRTPNIDSLARDGMKLTSFYVHQRCSPSRLAFMTGSYAHRAGCTKVIYPRDRIGINPAEITTPELLKQAGYVCGIVGTWHLGDWEPFHPLNHGFDYFKSAWHVNPDGGEAGEVAPPTDRTLDGVNLLPVLLGETDAALPRKSVIMAGSTIRQGDWKLFLKAEKPGGKGNEGGKETPAGSLYNVASDPGETTDVSAAHPEVVQRLRVAAEAFEKELATHSRPIGRLEGDDKDKPNTKTRKNKKEKVN